MSDPADAKLADSEMHPDQLTPDQIGAAVMSFALLADRTRVQMLWALRNAELDVASQHLFKLRFAGLVEG
ncbi:MAG: hypothetical protein ABI384_10985 [Allobranchiibius sp.]